MWAKTNRLLSRIVEWLDLPDAMSSADRIRVRLFCIASLCFMGVAIINFIGLTWAFGLATQHHMVSAFIALSGGSFLFLLRRFKDPIALTWTFAIMATLGGWLSAYIDYASATEVTGIGLAYAPYMVAILVTCCLIGTRSVAIFYAGLCIFTLIGFYATTVALNFPPDILQQNRMSVILRSTAILLTLGIMVPASQFIFRTVTDLEHTVVRANKAEKARKELLATMSHEIRTPLNGIISVTDLLERREEDATTRSHLNIISLSAGNLLDIVNTSLNQARSEHLGDDTTSSVILKSEPFNPAELLQQTCDLFTAHAGQKNLWLGTYGLSDLPNSVLGDAAQLRQVMNNLVGNAIKFTQEGGIRIGARIMNQSETTTTIQFFVQDTGVGIEPEAQIAVFKRFEQSASAQMTESTGTGLGLAICNDIVTAMGGTISMQSVLGEGTSFYFTLVLNIPHSHAASEVA